MSAIVTCFAAACFSLPSPNNLPLPEPMPPQAMIIPIVPGITERRHRNENGQGLRQTWEIDVSSLKFVKTQGGSLRPKPHLFQPSSRRSSVRPSVEG